MAGSPDSLPSGDLSKEETRLAVHIARQYFLEDKSKVAIADELGMSRFKVARLLDRARSEGIVTIKIASPDLFDRDLSAQLASDLGVPNVLVADPILPGSAIDDVAALAAAHLRGIVTADSVLGIAWSRATRALSEQLAGLPPCTVAQLCGVMPEPDQEEHNVELVRRAARACGGKAVTFYAPLVLPDAATAKTLRLQPGIAEALALCDDLSVAVIAVGQWEPRSSTVYDYLPEAEAEALSRRGAVAESCGLLFDADGAVIPDGLQERLVAVTESQLRHTGPVVALATEPERAHAIRALSRSGLLTTLVTHRHVAERLLAMGGAS
jgi:DNA-binding transcriptional regulator LsrR (DeoR family)